MLCAVLIFATLAYGAVDTWAFGFLSVFTGLIAVFWLLDAWFNREFRFDTSLLQLPVVGLLLVGLIQLLPLRPADIPAGALTRFLRSGDMNRDGRPDLAVCNEGAHTLNVFLGNGDGTFGSLASMPVDSTDGSASVTDLNGDGTPDLAITLLSGSIGLYWNRGD